MWFPNAPRGWSVMTFLASANLRQIWNSFLMLEHQLGRFLLLMVKMMVSWGDSLMWATNHSGRLVGILHVPEVLTSAEVKASVCQLKYLDTDLIEVWTQDSVNQSLTPAPNIDTFSSQDLILSQGVMSYKGEVGKNGKLLVVYLCCMYLYQNLFVVLCMNASMKWNSLLSY